MAAAFEEAGVPKGLVSVLSIAHPDIQSVIEDDRIAAVTLTGSVRAGAAVASQSGRAIKKTVLELGGSDPRIVLADADLPRAVNAAIKAPFQNAGKTCIAAKPIIVEAPAVGEFSARAVEAVKVLKVGDPMDEATDKRPDGPSSVDGGVKCPRSNIWALCSNHCRWGCGRRDRVGQSERVRTVSGNLDRGRRSGAKNGPKD